MAIRIVVAGEEPSRIDSVEANQRGKHVDQESAVDHRILVRDQMAKRGFRESERSAYRLEVDTGLACHHAPDALGDGFDEGIVGGQRHRHRFR